MPGVNDLEIPPADGLRKELLRERLPSQYSDHVIQAIEMDRLLPVRRDRGHYKWPENVKYSLLALAKGPRASQVESGEALYDCILDMQRESGQQQQQQQQQQHMARDTADGISLFFDDLLSRHDARNFFHKVLPGIANLALSLPLLLGNQASDLTNLFAFHGSETTDRVQSPDMVGSRTDMSGSRSNIAGSRSDMVDSRADMAGYRPAMGLRLLCKQQPGMVALSQRLVASLLACSFLCLYPSAERRRENLPHVNLDRLFAGIYERGESIEHKLLCLLHYFERVCEEMPEGVVSFERKVVTAQNLRDSNAFWSDRTARLCPLTVVVDGNIEDLGQDCLQVDFANKMLGGGALADGCVQEEIRFMINPELAAGMVFLPAMAANESIEIVGAERYSCYTGYASSFRFTGDFRDSRPRDAWGRRQTHIIAIDALSQPGDDQFRLTHMMRELSKAYCGFLDTGSSLRGSDECDAAVENVILDEPSGTSDENVVQERDGGDLGIATGNWGCGVFGGNLQLKSMLQWLAASQAGRPYVLYFSFQNPDAQRLQEVADWILQEGWLVGELWCLVSEYARNKQFKVNLFDWILPLPGTDLAIPQPSQHLDRRNNYPTAVPYFLHPRGVPAGIRK